MSTENMWDLLEIMLDYAQDKWYNLDLSEVLSNWIKAEVINWKKYLIIWDEKLTANITYGDK
jgi:hypothetical protein